MLRVFYRECVGMLCDYCGDGRCGSRAPVDSAPDKAADAARELMAATSSPRRSRINRDELPGLCAKLWAAVAALLPHEREEFARRFPCLSKSADDAAHEAALGDAVARLDAVPSHCPRCKAEQLGAPVDVLNAWAGLLEVNRRTVERWRQDPEHDELPGLCAKLWAAVAALLPHEREEFARRFPCLSKSADDAAHEAALGDAVARLDAVPSHCPRCKAEQLGAPVDVLNAWASGEPWSCFACGEDPALPDDGEEVDIDADTTIPYSIAGGAR